MFLVFILKIRLNIIFFWEPTLSYSDMCILILPELRKIYNCNKTYLVPEKSLSNEKKTPQKME